MFQDLTLLEILAKGGPVFFFMMAVVAVVLVVIVERILAYQRIEKNSAKFLTQIRTRVEDGKFDEALACKRFSRALLSASMSGSGRNSSSRKRAAGRASQSVST